MQSKSSISTDGQKENQGMCFRNMLKKWMELDATVFSVPLCFQKAWYKVLLLRGQEGHCLVRYSYFVKELDLISIMAAGSKTKVQDVNLKCTCPVCFSW